MKENDFQRRRRDREFHVRLLAVLEKLAAAETPKRSSFIAMLNSAFFLWLLSTVLIVMGGGYITNHLQCLRDARQIIDHRQSVLRELQSRSTALLEAVESASTPQQLFITDRIRGKGDDALSKMSYVDLLMDYTNTLMQVGEDRLPYPDIEKSEFNWIRVGHRTADIELDTTVSGLNGPRSFNIIADEDSFRHRKMSTVFRLTAQYFEYSTDFRSYYAQPNCSMLNVALAAAGYNPRIVYASFNDIFDVQSDFHNTKAKLDAIQAAIAGKDIIAKPH